MAQSYHLPPNPARLIEGLRDTGYDFNTALTDIVDNCVDAYATIIDIQIKMDIDGEIFVSVADNGIGMDKNTLLDGMTYGATGRIDPKRLGKFGLGLKTASTAFCRKLSVITRDNAESSPIKATWDLDHVVHTQSWDLLIDEPNSFEFDIFNQIADNSTGTLVIWNKVDRLLKNQSTFNGNSARKAIDRIVSSFKDHISMVYQRFLDTNDNRARNLIIYVNKLEIHSWDPFCTNITQTEKVAENKTKVELSDGSISDFIIKAYILPRREQFPTTDAAKEARLNNNMQGMYIYRENRLIHYADWLGMFTKEPHLSLLRVEFSFNHELDEAFQVDIKKSTIVLNEDLYSWVLNKFMPAPRNAANERYRTGENKRISDIAKGAHDDSNRSISEKEANLRKSEITVINKETNEVDIKNKSGIVRLKLNIIDDSSSSQICIQPAESIEDGLLWRPALINNRHAVSINTGHPYYKKVYMPNIRSGVTIQGMDSLLWALAEAELGTIHESTKTHFEELRFEVSRLLRKLVEDLPEPNINEA